MIARSLCLLGLFCVVHGAYDDNDIWDDGMEEAEFEAEFETPARALAGPGSGGSVAPAPSPPVPDTKVSIANTVSGFTKVLFTTEFQKAFITASADVLGVATAQVTLGPITDGARRLSGRQLLRAGSIKFDTIVTLTQAELIATPTLLASVQTKATAVSTSTTALISKFVADQVNAGVPAADRITAAEVAVVTAAPTTSGGATPTPAPKDGGLQMDVVATVLTLLAVAIIVTRNRFVAKAWCFAPEKGANAQSSFTAQVNRVCRCMNTRSEGVTTEGSVAEHHNAL